MTQVARGIYRRIYAGFLNGERINSVSWKAEAWFWRLQALADDLGHLPGNPRYLAVAASPRREVSTAEAARLTDELVAAQLVQRYEAEGQPYLAIAPNEWNEIQPAGKNGKRLARHPVPPGSILDSPKGESQVNPDFSKVNPAPPTPTPIPIPIPTPTPIAPLPPAEPGGGREGGRVAAADVDRSASFDRNAAIAEIAAAFPPSNGFKSPGAIGHALYALAGPGIDARHPSEAEAAAWLLGRVRTYAGSRRVRTTPQDKRPAMKRWFDEAMYDAPDADWDVPYKHAAGQATSTATGPMRTGALERIKAEDAARAAGGVA